MKQFLVTGFSNASSTRVFQLFDSEKEAKDCAEAYIKKDFNEISVWSLVSAPTVERTIKW